MKIKQIVDKEGNLHILRFYSSSERIAIRKNNLKFCNFQHRQDMEMLKTYLKKKAANEAKEHNKKLAQEYNKTYYQRPEVKQRTKEHNKRPEVRARLKAYQRAYYHLHKK